MNQIGILVTLATSLNFLALHATPPISLMNLKSNAGVLLSQPLSLKTKARIFFHSVSLVMSVAASWALPRIMPINGRLPSWFALGTPGGYVLCVFVGACFGEMATGMATSQSNRSLVLQV